MKKGVRKKKGTTLRVKSSKTIFEGRVFSVTRDVVVEPGGVQIARDVVRHAGSAVILLRRRDGRVLLVRQFRLPTRQYLWELAAGRLDRGERPLDAARRELREETGFTARRWKLLAEFFPSPGYVNEKMWLYLAEDLRPGPAQPDPDEVVHHRWFSVPRLEQMVRRGRIKDAKTLLGYFLLPAARSSKSSTSR